MQEKLAHDLATHAASEMQFNAMCDRLDQLPNVDRQHALAFLGTLIKAVVLHIGKKHKEHFSLATRRKATELLLEKYYAGRGGHSALNRNQHSALNRNPHRLMQPEYEYEEQGVKFSHKGYGTTSQIQDIEYFGFSVRMRPSMFLKLTLLGKYGQQESFSDEELKWVRTAMHSGKAFGVPFLKFSRKEHNRGPDWRCNGHEGRHRMSVLMREHNDEPIPIAVMIRDGGETRARNVTNESIITLNKGAWSEWFDGALPKLIKGPLFVGNAYVQGSPVVVSNPTKQVTGRFSDLIGNRRLK